MQLVKPYILPAVLMGAFVFVFFPALADLIHRWETSEDYAHAFFVVPIIAYMIWQKRANLQDKAPSNIIGCIMVILSLIVYQLALYVQIPTFIFLSLVLFVISAFIFVAGFGFLACIIVPILLMFMIIPIPNQILAAITASLQLRVSEISEIIVRFFSVPMFREGNVLHIKDMTFAVVDACSGIRSLISMTTLAVIIGYFTLTKISSKIVLFILSIPVAILANIIRVVTLVFAYHFYKINLTEGLAHTALGMILFGVGLLLLFSFQRVLEKWETKKTNK